MIQKTRRYQEKWAGVQVVTNTVMMCCSEKVNRVCSSPWQLVMEERVTYQEIKSWILESLYDDCRSRGYGHQWTYSQILSAINDGYCYRGESYKPPLSEGLGGFDSVIEYLMLEVICLILSGGWDTKQDSYYRNEISKILADNDLTIMLNSLPDDERIEFEMDLKMLEIVS